MLSSFAGGSSFGRRHGDGRPRVLALHGWRRTHRDWDSVLDGLDAIALDLPGFGATPAPSEPWGLAEYAAHVAPVLEEVANGCVVIGHSFGGSVAVELASGSRGAGIGALVLTGTPLIRGGGGGGRPPLGFRLARRLNRLGLYSDRRMEARRLERGSEDYRAAQGVMRDTFVTVVNQDVAHHLAALDVPTALVWGSEDTAAPARIAHEAHALIDGSTLEILPGVGHDVPAERPAALRSAIEGLLEQQNRA